MKKTFLLLSMLIFSFLCFVEIPKVYGEPDKTITYDPSTNIITAIGGNETDPINFNDLWETDKAGTYELEPSENYDGIDTIFLDNQPKPTDYKELYMRFNVTYFDSELDDVEVRMFGYDQHTNNIGEELIINGIGQFISEVNYGSINYMTLDSYPPKSMPFNVTFSIYQGQWGVVWKTGDSQFMFDARIVLGNGTVEGTTTFIDKAKQIVFNESAFNATAQIAISVRRYSYLTFGTLVDETTKTTREGIDFVIKKIAFMPLYLLATSEDYNTHDRQLYVYSSSFQTIGNSINRILANVRGGNNRFWNVFIKRGAGLVILPFATGSPTINIFNFISQDTDNRACFTVYGSTGLTIEKVTVASATNLIWTQQDATFTITDVYSRLHNNVFYGSTNWGSGGNAYLINFDVDNWNMTFVASSTGEVYRQYEFDLNITDIEDSPIENANVTVSHYGENPGVDFTVLTGSNGSFSTKTLTMGFYNQTGGNSLYSYNPYNIRIEASGYDTYSGNFTLNEVISSTIILQRNYAIGLGSGFILAFILSMALLAVGAVVISRRRS